MPVKKQTSPNSVRKADRTAVSDSPPRSKEPVRIGSKGRRALATSAEHSPLERDRLAAGCTPAEARPKSVVKAPKASRARACEAGEGKSVEADSPGAGKKSRPALDLREDRTGPRSQVGVREPTRDLSRIGAGERQSRIRRRPVVKKSSMSVGRDAPRNASPTELPESLRAVAETRTTFVGIDAHKERLVVCVLPPASQPVELSCANREKEIRALARKLKTLANDGEVRACYEAGPTGYGIKRTLESEGITCEVVAPALIPMKVGDRIKTDRRDARKLGELNRAGLLTEVAAPTPHEESVRELCRSRLRAKADLARARNKLGKMLLRHSLIFTGRAWTQAYMKWLTTLTFEHDATALVFQDLVAECEHLDGRVKRLDQHIERYAETMPYAKQVAALCCLRGVRVLTAMVLLTELFRFKRFEDPRALMSFLGLTPSEHSSGGREQRGSITKAGNQHVRRLLVEAAKHARKPANQSAELARRRDGQRADVVAIARKAQDRLNRRYWRLVNGGKHPNKATVAVARELAGFIWAILRTTGGGEVTA